MDCEVAREALSARLDGEREPVPSARVDEHLVNCADCRAWREHVVSQAQDLRRLARARPTIARLTPFGTGRLALPPTRRVPWARSALLVVGVVQIGLSVVQAIGLPVGLMRDHAMAGHHLLNESTAWSAALGVVMVAAALRPSVAAGLAGVLIVFTGLLAVYVVADAIGGTVTAERMLTHLPVLIGALLTTIVWRRGAAPPPAPSVAGTESDIVLPDNASRGRRRGHLWPTDGSAA